MCEAKENCSNKGRYWVYNKFTGNSLVCGRHLTLTINRLATIRSRTEVRIKNKEGFWT